MPAELIETVHAVDAEWIRADAGDDPGIIRIGEQRYEYETAASDAARSHVVELVPWDGADAYRAWRTRHGLYGCTCPDFEMRSGRAGTGCKHLAALWQLRLLPCPRQPLKRTSIMTTETRLAERGETAMVPAANEPRGIAIRSMADLWSFAKLYVASGIAPKGMNPEAVAVAVQTGLELGLSPAQAVQSIAVINGRPQVYGPTAQALIESSGLLEDIDIYFTEGGQRTDHLTRFDDSTEAVCTTKRRGRRPYTTRFSVADAKRAKLWGRAGPWTDMPQRMLKWRACSHNFNDNFGDVLKGLEADDAARNAAPAITITQEPASPPVAKAKELPPPREYAPEPPATMPGKSARDEADLRLADVIKAYFAAGFEKADLVRESKQIIGDVARKDMDAGQLDRLAAHLTAITEPPQYGDAADTTEALAR